MDVATVCRTTPTLKAHVETIKPRRTTAKIDW